MRLTAHLPQRAPSLAALVTALSLTPLGATPIAGDSFRTGNGYYTTGDNNLVGQNPTTPGFTGSWLEAFGGSAAPDVNGGTLVYNALTALSSGGSLLSDTNGRSGRVLATTYDDTSTGTVYLSFLLQTGSVAAAYRGFELHSGGFDDGNDRVLQLVTGEPGIGSADSNYIVRIFNQGGFAADLGAGDTDVNLFVIRMDFSTTNNGDVVTIYRNPEDLGDEGLSTADAVLTGFNFRFDRTTLANFSNGDTVSLDELRLGTAWADVVGALDSEPDGMPDAWEAVNGLTIGVNDSTGDGLFDNDGLNNLAEYNNNTDPNNADTDGDDLNDGPEISGSLNTKSSTPTDPLNPDSDFDGLADGDELDTLVGASDVSDPADVDSDNDGFADKTEVDAGSDPCSAASTPGTFLAADFIGLDYFDIADGSIGGVTSGEGFDFDNSSERDSFVGHTSTFSDWDGSAVVTGGKLQTQNSSNAFREFNGPGEGAALNSDEREGIYDDLTFSSNTTLYFKVKLARQCDATYSGLSLFNMGGGEELFYGVLGSNGEFGLEEAGEGNLDSTGTTPTELQEYTIVGSVDIDLLEANFWLDPTLGGAEPAADATLDLGISDFALDSRITRLRLESGGDGVVEWDELVVATTWAGLSTAPTSAGDDPNLRDTFEATFALTSGAANADTDGLTNQQEHDGNSNPTEDDTDGDGIDDDEEVVSGSDGEITNPRLADSDGDGVDDLDEISGALNTFNGAATDPNDCDSDNDGEDDGFEIGNGTDPNDAGSNSSTLGLVIIDGVRDASYGSAITVQTVQTEFGDNQSEWNAAYAQIKDGKLYLMFTGNLQDNFNKLEIFIDSTDVVTTTTFTAAGNDFLGQTNNLNGMVFDAGFTPDYHLIARRGNGAFDFDFAALGTTPTFAEFFDVFGGSDSGSGTTPLSSSTNGTLTLQHGIEIGYDGSNTAGVAGGTGAADQTAAQAVTTGLELCIDLCDLGAPDDEDIRISIIQSSADHNFLSNQSLAGLPAGTGNLGTPSAVDFTTLTGDQFFSVNVPAGSANPCDVAPLVLSIDYTGGDAVLTWTPASTAVDIYDTGTLVSPFNGPISTNDTDGTHTVSPAPAGARFYIAVPTGSPAP